MATVVELKARAKKMGYKGYSKMKKAELEKLLTTPPPKPPRTAKKAPAKEDEGVFDVVRATIGGVKYLVEKKKSLNREVFLEKALKEDDPKPIGYISGEITPKTKIRFIPNRKPPAKKAPRRKKNVGTISGQVQKVSPDELEILESFAKHGY
jgi:hypothetical protein